MQFGEGQRVTVAGIGIVKATPTGKSNKHEIVMKAVLYVPTMMCNLISVSKARRSGFRVVFDSDDQSNGYCHIIHNLTGLLYIQADETDPGLYDALMCPTKTQTALISSDKAMWHKRMEHVSEETLRKTTPLVQGMPLQPTQGVGEGKFERCSLRKSCRSPRPSASDESKKATVPLELVHADIVGPIKHSSLSGKQYFVPLYDDSTGVSLVRFIKTKDAAGAAIKEMITSLESLRQNRVRNLQITCYETEQDRMRRLRTDNGMEFLSNNFRKWLAKKGIHHELTSAYSPESNGKAERLNRTLLDMARTMLLSVPHLPKKKHMWAEAVNASCFLRNRMFTSASNEKKPHMNLC